mgnify:CR=1 FL=1
MLPVALSGAAASSVYADVQMVEVTYHMQPGYQDAGDALTAYVLVEQTPTGATTAQVQLSSVEGLARRRDQPRYSDPLSDNHHRSCNGSDRSTTTTY